VQGSGLSYNFAVSADGDDVQRNILAAVLYCAFNGIAQTAAAGDSHSCDGYAFYIIEFEYLHQLLGIVHTVQLGAADEGHTVFHEIIVEAAISISGAIRCNKQVCAVIERRNRRQQLYLHREVFKASVLKQGCVAAAFFQRFLVCKYCGLIISGSFTLLEADCVHGAGGQAVTQTVTVILAHKLCLALHNADGTLVAGFGAQATAVAFALVYLNYSSYHICQASVDFLGLIIV